jgi:Tfp pilus assembly protein PilX
VHGVGTAAGNERKVAVERGLARRIRGTARCQRGFALPLALVALLAIGSMASGTLSYATWNAGSSKRTDAEARALALAEAGLNAAYATLYNSSSPTMDNAVPSRTVQVDDGEMSYAGTLSGSTWRLVGTGSVRNPTGPGAAPVTRSVSGRVAVGSARRGTGNNGIWNYIYVDDPMSTTDLVNSVDINIPLYTQGNLRLLNSAQVSADALQVKGWMELHNSSHVGTSTDTVHEVHVGGGCRLGSSGAYATCGTAHRVHAEISDTSPGAFTKPPVDMPGWYENAAPGPRRGCTTGSFPGGFDNDAVRNSSRPAVDLLPSTSYDCRVYDGAGALIGQLTWNAGTKRLTMHGTIYFDGPIQFRNSNFAVYSGRATIYASGNITFANSTTLCGDDNCDADWVATRDLLAFVSGGNVATANSTRFQGAVYAVGDYSEANSSTVWGPIIARRVAFANSSVNHYVPIGTLMPGMPASYEEVVTLTNEPGSWGQ